MVPIYSRSEKLSQKFIREIIHLCLQTGLPLLEELIPEEVRNRHALPGIAESIQAMHFPEEMPISEIHHSGDLSPYLRRLIFEEFFKFQLVLLMDRAGLQIGRAHV